MEFVLESCGIFLSLGELFLNFPHLPWIILKNRNFDWSEKFPLCFAIRFYESVKLRFKIKNDKEKVAILKCVKISRQFKSYSGSFNSQKCNRFKKVLSKAILHI
jgi:hypothetical protein